MRLFVMWTVLALAGAVAMGQEAGKEPKGVLPLGDDGKPLNLDFETGTLKDWTVAGQGFKQQPIKGDVINERRGDMHSNHAGKFWVGTYEGTESDGPRGSITSVAFKV